MIVSLATQVQDLLKRQDSVQKKKAKAAKIEDTYTELRSVRGSINTLISDFELMKHALEENTDLEIRTQVDGIIADVAASRDSFLSGNREVTNLRSIHGHVKETRQMLVEAWSNYAKVQYESRVAPWRVIQNLPEAEALALEVQPIDESIQQYLVSPPMSADDVRQFESLLQDLTDLLSQRGYGSLSPTITQFLDRVREGHATMADLTDEILAWCWENPERVSAFRIVF